MRDIRHQLTKKVTTNRYANSDNEERRKLLRAQPRPIYIPFHPHSLRAIIAPTPHSLPTLSRPVTRALGPGILTRNPRAHKLAEKEKEHSSTNKQIYA